MNLGHLELDLGVASRPEFLGEQAMATLQGWRLLRKHRCSTNHIIDLVKAVLVVRQASA
ncbi:hypothetical protein [Streptomyces sp. NPDC054787]